MKKGTIPFCDNGFFGVTRVIANQLFGVSPYDPATIAGVIAVISVAGVPAATSPRERPMRVDPIIALRYES